MGGLVYIDFNTQLILDLSAPELETFKGRGKAAKSFVWHLNNFASSPRRRPPPPAYDDVDDDEEDYGGDFYINH